MSASELMQDARLGTIGAGVGYYTRPYIVIDPTDRDGNTCDPRFDDELPKIYTGHPSIQGPIARHFALVRAYSATQFQVEVIYESPTASGGSWGSAWQVRVMSSLQTERVEREVGPSPSDHRGRSDPAWRRIVGPYVYHRVYQPGPWPPDGIDPNPPDATTPPTGAIVFKAGPYELWLEKEEKDRKRIPVGMDRYRGIASVTASRTATGMIDPAAIAAYTGKVNAATTYVTEGSGRQYIFAEGSLFFESFNVTPDLGATGVDHIVELIFTHDSEGHQFYLPHDYTDPDGGVYAVERDMSGTMVQAAETFTRQLSANFTTLFSIA